MKEDRNAAYCCGRNNRPRGMGRTNHRIDLLLRKNAFNSKSIRLIGIKPGLRHGKNLQNTLIKRLSGGGSRDPHVNEAGFAIGGHVNHAKPAAGKPRIYTHNAGGASRARLIAKRMVFLRRCVHGPLSLLCWRGCVYSSCPSGCDAGCLVPYRNRARA